MNKNDITEFFDRCADSWDKNQFRNEAVIETILDKSGVVQSIKLLDVACGTGVLFGDYIKREVACVTGIDISAKMLKIAKKKFPQVNLICGDAECHTFEDEFDVIMIYNAFPHFPNPEKLFRNLSSVLKKGGRLTVAHGISMQEVEKCHKGAAAGVSLALPSKQVLAQIMASYIEVDVMLSDDNMYMVSGVKR